MNIPLGILGYLLLMILTALLSRRKKLTPPEMPWFAFLFLTPFLFPVTIVVGIDETMDKLADENEQQALKMDVDKWSEREMAEVRALLDRREQR